MGREPMTRLREDEMVCAEVLLGQGRSVRSIARDLGVDESTVRYRIGRRKEGALDGRSMQGERCSAHEGAIAAWMEAQVGSRRPESVRVLYEDLVCEHGYTGSYKAVLRYVRRRTEEPKVRPGRRVETRPGGQAQVDWFDVAVYIEDLGGVVGLRAFLMALGHSRMWAVVWCLREDMLSWIDAHNRSFEFLGGVTATVRIDNLKTGVSSGAGHGAVLNEGYRSYAKQMGFVIDPCRVKTPTDKGKVERRGRDLKHVLIREADRFQDLEHLQRVSGERIVERARRLVCPVTGQSVYDTWRDERGHLQPLPETLPEPFDVQVSREVGEGCLVPFEGRRYAVPFTSYGRTAEIRGCAGTVKIYGEGRLLITYPRNAGGLVLVDQRCYEGEGDGRVIPPTPLGEIARQIVLQKSWEAPRRGIEPYAAVVGGMS
jgi:transposase